MENAGKIESKGEDCENIKASGSIIALCHGENPDGSRKFSEWVRFVKDVGIEDDEPFVRSTSIPPRDVMETGQIGILSWKTIAQLIADDSRFEFGHCRENICVAYADLSNLQPGDLLQVGRARLEVTSVGKTCQQPCPLSFSHDEQCLVARTWISAKVVKGGQVCVDDSFLATCCV